MKFTLSVATAALSASLAAAQTFSDCNPVKKSCPPIPALGGTASFDMKTPPENWKGHGGKPNYGGEAAAFTMAKPGDAPTIVSNFYIMYGNVELVVKSAPGKGVVSSAHLQSDCLDEIDWEWLGSDNGQVQTNYFRLGDTTSYDRVGYHQFGGHQDAFHTYTIDWTADKVDWMIDGNSIRTLTKAAAGDKFPQTPMDLHIGPWAGGDPDQSPPGTVEWAQGPMNWADAPFTMFVKSIKVTDYSTGKQYKYNDNSGTIGSVESVGGQIDGQGSPGEGPEVESPSPKPPSDPEPTAPQPAPTATDPPTTLESVGPSLTSSLAGLPSDWIISDTGRVSTGSSTSARNTVRDRLITLVFVYGLYFRWWI